MCRSTFATKEVSLREKHLTLKLGTARRNFKSGLKTENTTTMTVYDSHFFFESFIDALANYDVDDNVVCECYLRRQLTPEEEITLRNVCAEFNWVYDFDYFPTEPNSILILAVQKNQ